MLPSTNKEVRVMKSYETPTIDISELKGSDVITVSIGDTPIIEWWW